MSIESDKLTLEKLFLGKARIKTIDVLLNYKEVNISKIIKESHLNYPIVLRHLRVLKSYGLICETVKDSNRIFSINRSNPIINVISKLRDAIECVGAPDIEIIAPEEIEKTID